MTFAERCRDASQPTYFRCFSFGTLQRTVAARGERQDARHGNDCKVRQQVPKKEKRDRKSQFSAFAGSFRSILLLLSAKAPPQALPSIDRPHR